MPLNRRQLLSFTAAGNWLCIQGVGAMTKEIMLMDFTHPVVVQKLWVVNDSVMGGVSQSQLLARSDGVIFQGLVSLENNGGFASMRAPVSIPPQMRQIKLRARGDTKLCKLTLRTSADTRAPIYQCDFITNSEWTNHHFQVTDFKPSFRGRSVDAAPLVFSEVVEFGVLIADQQAGPFQIQLRSLHCT